jgi:hypothetical protein
VHAMAVLIELGFLKGCDRVVRHPLLTLLTV